MGKLLIVGTPIGNLGDLSPRGRAALEEADFIAAEDTRVTQKLLNHFGIKTPTLSYHEHNLRERGPQIIARLMAGETCALVTDAGMPAISDPGEALVALCHQQQIPVAVIPGPTAALSALAAAGLPTGRFSFEGFLSTRKTSRKDHLEMIKDDPRTLIFYEAPHKLRATLQDLCQALGEARPVTICRELTKLHEEIWPTTLGEAAAAYQQREPKGEFVLVVGGAPPKAEAPALTLEEAAGLVAQLAGCGVALSEAAKQVAKDTGYPKSELYRLALQQK